MPTFEARVAANGDDGAWQDSGADPDLITTGGNLIIGSGGGAGDFWSLTVHYDNVTIPAGSTINVAFLRFVSRFADSLTVMRTNVHGVEEVNPTAPVNVGDAKGKALTAGAAWDAIPAWSVDEDGSDTQTVDIAPAVQTIVDQGGWVSGNAMEFQILDDGTDLSNRFRRPFSHNTDPAKTALVHIEYTEPPGLPAGAPGGTSWGIGRRADMIPY